MTQLLARLEQSIVRWILQGTQPALVGATVGPSSTQSAIPVTVDDLVGSFSILWGVPVRKTAKSKLWTRRHGITRLLQPRQNIVSCQKCGRDHELHTICGHCYDKVRLLTNRIKEKMMLAYDPYEGEMPDKETKVVFADDEAVPEPNDRTQVIQLDESRPTWFSRELTAKWQAKK